MVVVWWCFCSGVVVFLWWCGVVFVVVVWWCFCGGVVLFLLWWCGGVFMVVLLWWCGGVFVVVLVWWGFCGGVVARELGFGLGVLQDCGFGLGVFGVFVVVWWCQHPARELVLFGGLQDCGFGLGVFVVVFLKVWWWCGGVNIRPENSGFSVFCNKDVLARGITTL